MPNDQAALETLNFAIATCYAPTINQLAKRTGKFSYGLS